MFRKFALIIISILAITSIQANPKQISSHGNHFLLNRSIVVVVHRTESQSAAEVVKILNSFGISARTARSAVASKARIVLEKVKVISGVKEPDALQVIVTANKVTIRYTTEASRVKAIGYFKQIIDNNTVQGYNITDWSGSSHKAIGGVLDVSSRLFSMAEIENYARGVRNRNAFVQFVSPKSWRLESSVFTLVNPKESIYPQGGFYKMAQVAGLVDKLEKSRITIIPVIDLLNPNVPFEKVTGHSMFSVEGMRFVRAIIEEYSEKLGCKKICIGSMPENADKRYVEFVNDIAGRCGVELIIKE